MQEQQVWSTVGHVAGTKDHFHISLEDEVVRGSIIAQNGQLLWPPPPPPAPAPGSTPARAPKPIAEKPVPVEPNYFANTLKDAAMYTGGNMPHCPSSLAYI
jgi:NAD(P) transhydrogenase